uniref:Uncharacterized protein n=1 Tax=Fagus sylvatica TaxID=28930 RepID=A0A2N9HHH0_FAGSY
MKAGSAAKLIVDALLQRFLPLARRRIETAQAQDGQYLRPSDPAYEQVLDSLAMIARHTPVPLLEALLKWRERFLKFEVGNGSRIRFWDDVWCLDKPLKVVYPELYRIACVKDAAVADYIYFRDETVHWEGRIRCVGSPPKIKAFREIGASFEHCDMEGHPSVLDVVSLEGVQLENFLGM